MRYGIWTTCSGGILDTLRADWMKLNGQVAVYTSHQAASNAVTAFRDATPLKGGTTPSDRPIAVQTFTVMEYDDET